MAIAWVKPPLGQFKLNSDANVFNGHAFDGGLVRTHKGKLVFTYYKKLGDCIVVLTEAYSLLHGLHVCKKRRV